MTTNSNIPLPVGSKRATKITLSYGDRIAQCKQQPVNNWESDFLGSVLRYVNSSKFAGLSDKQDQKLKDIEKNFNLSRYYNDDGTKPFAEDKEDMKVIKPAAPPAPPAKPSYFDDDEDDIPF